MIVVTGATGKLGRHIISALFETTPAAEIVAAVRNPEKASALSQLGVQVREADYSRPETLRTAFAGATKLCLISSNEVGLRIPQHQAVIDAAKEVGVQLLVYTSILRANTSTLVLAREHKATEEYVRSSGLPFVFLRNGWYMENQTEALAPALQHGAILGAAGEGRFAAASRADYAGAASAVLTTSGHQYKVYELAGDQPYTLSDLAAEVSKQSGKAVAYQNLEQTAYAAALTGFGLPVQLADALADADAGAERGELDSTARDLSRLLGRPTTTLSAAVNAAL